MPFDITKASPRLQAILKPITNVEGLYTFNDIYSLIAACFEVLPRLTGANIPQPTIDNLIKPIQAAIETQAALIKSIQSYQSKMSSDEGVSNKNIHDNELILYNQLKGIQDNMQGLKKDVSNMKTSFGNQASIIDTLADKVQANSDDAFNLRSLLKDHIATKHIPTTHTAKVVYVWDVQPYELNIRTKTSVPSAGHRYEFKYTLNGVETGITNSDTNLKIGEELGTLTYTPLNSGVSKVVIEEVTK